MKSFKTKTMLGAAYLLFAAGASAQTPTPGLPTVPLGYCQLTSIDAAAKLSACSGGIPKGATAAYIEAEAQAIRYRDDGVAPTASVGMPVVVSLPFFYSGTLSALQVISSTSGAKLNVLFYRSP